jgi:DNA mismatch repair protein MutH
VSVEKFDKSSPDSILQFAERLTGKTLVEALGYTPKAAKAGNKGGLASQVEEHYFGIKPNNSPEPDFPKAGVELKVTGMLKSKKNSFKPKERLILKMIDYMSIVNESWEGSALLKKCKLMLMVFYLYDKDATSFLDFKFALKPFLFDFPKYDAYQIKEDWKKIRKKVLEGKAHELSEGDTMYLGACRKGSGGVKEKGRAQPFSEVLAYGRAYSLKTKYVQKIIDGSVSDSVLGTSEDIGVEEATLNRFLPYLGLPANELQLKFGIGNSKNWKKTLVMRILGTTKSNLPELEKAGVIVKTICVNSNWRPRESMSFPNFKYRELVNQDWEESDFCETVETKFLFVIFRFDDEKVLRLEFAAYWNMPFADREEARRVWEETKKRILTNPHNLPKISESHVAHVRPHARNSRDTDTTPGGERLVKQCFWLNAGYIAGVIDQLRSS